MPRHTAATAPLARSLPQTAQRPLDMVHLGRQTLGDSGLQGEVLRLFADALRTYYGRLETSTTRNDLMVNLHALKGAASGVGAFALAQLARTAEDELRNGAPVSPERIDDIGIAVEELQAFIGPMVADQPAE
jgi:HPt (histidine-containing phosphotransfer) domain-containing protein